MKKNISLLIIGLAAAFATSCKDDDDIVAKHGGNGAGNTEIPATTLEANLFVKTAMSEFYYWYKYMPSVDYKTQASTEAYFDTLLYEKDRFSYIVSDADAYKAEKMGISTSIGADVTFMYEDATKKHVVAAVNYVYKNTPAYTAKMLRGDYIYAIDGEKMTPENYRTLFYKQTATYGIRRFTSETGEATDVNLRITASEIQTSPLAEHTVFNVDGHKIAYLLYMDYYTEFNNDMIAIFEEFKSAGATDLILDLRYNQGGDGNALDTLCSLIAPKADVAEGKEIMHAVFNDKLNKEGYMDYFRDCFSPGLAEKSLDLESVVFITGGRTYSASEATMLDLAPFMNTYKIGATTGGKNTMMFVITPNWYTYKDSDKRFFSTNIDNFILLPIVATYYNSNDETFNTDNGRGMEPDYAMNEYAYRVRGTLGKEDEPLTAAAIEYITKGEIAGNKSERAAPELMEMPASAGRLIMNPSEKIGKRGIGNE